MRTRSKLPFRGAALALFLAAGALWPGCGYSPGDYCHDLCDCVGCSDPELDGCIDDAEDLYDEAEKADCTQEANEYLSCLDSEGTCRGGFYDADGCEKEYDDASRCVYGF